MSSIINPNAPPQVNNMIIARPINDAQILSFMASYLHREGKTAKETVDVAVSLFAEVMVQMKMGRVDGTIAQRFRDYGVDIQTGEN